MGRGGEGWWGKRGGGSRGGLAPPRWVKLAPLTRVGLQRIGRAGGEALQSIKDAGAGPPPSPPRGKATLTFPGSTGPVDGKCGGEGDLPPSPLSK